MREGTRPAGIALGHSGAYKPCSNIWVSLALMYLCHPVMVWILLDLSLSPWLPHNIWRNGQHHHCSQGRNESCPETVHGQQREDKCKHLCLMCLKLHEKVLSIGCDGTTVTYNMNSIIRQKRILPFTSF